ncbi:unnamed protein product [Anisakis simplex]|uniref:Uncharacterized protein n=1 Tax=Anisakis simplex TaxID=6269 RepID=A0A0M3J441_ANISI|nr:unnamed protein product [Anisakis simplex]
MVDNKVNMSLGEFFIEIRDSGMIYDIIKKERADRNKRTPAARRGFASKRGAVGVKRGVGMRRNIRGGMRGASSSSWNNRTKPQTSINKNNTNNSQRSLRSSNNNLNKVATMRMVQKLVKKAINQRANQTIIQRAGVSNQRNRRANLLTRRRVIGARVPVCYKLDSNQILYII